MEYTEWDMILLLVTQVYYEKVWTAGILFFLLLGVARLDAIHVFGVDNMSTKDIFLYFDNYGPGSVEWIDDSCCKYHSSFY